MNDPGPDDKVARRRGPSLGSACRSGIDPSGARRWTGRGLQAGAVAVLRRGAVLATILVLLLPGPASAQLQVARPDASYRTFDTDHFRVVYVEGLEEVARRAARHAEEAHRTLTESFFPPPDRRIEILVTDHNDVSNGFAMVAPSPRMILWVRPPMDGTALSHFDDWIRVVTVHELAHVFHLEHTGPLGRISRKVFGRAPRSWPFFTGFYLPRWAVEGVAVQIETAHTDGVSGLLHGERVALEPNHLSRRERVKRENDH